MKPSELLFEADRILRDRALDYRAALRTEIHDSWPQVGDVMPVEVATTNSVNHKEARAAVDAAERDLRQAALDYAAVANLIDTARTADNQWNEIANAIPSDVVARLTPPTSGEG